MGVAQKLHKRGYAGFLSMFLLTRVDFGTGFLSHSHVKPQSEQSTHWRKPSQAQPKGATWDETLKQVAQILPSTRGCPGFQFGTCWSCYFCVCMAAIT